MLRLWATHKRYNAVIDFSLSCVRRRLRASVKIRATTPLVCVLRDVEQPTQGRYNYHRKLFRRIPNATNTSSPIIYYCEDRSKYKTTTIP